MRHITIEDVSSVNFRKSTPQEDAMAQRITIADGGSLHMPSDAVIKLMRCKPEDLVTDELRESDPAIFDEIDENTA